MCNYSFIFTKFAIVVKDYKKIILVCFIGCHTNMFIIM